MCDPSAEPPRRQTGRCRQACPELDLPGYDALDADGANINLAIGVEAADPVSGAASQEHTAPGVGPKC
jgi:hypothetical protein